jgi:hypothetical protein
MTRKQWIWITILLALIHILIVGLLTPISGGIIFSRFDGEAYTSPGDSFLVGLYFLLNIPYLLMVYYFRPIRLLPLYPTYFLIWVCNSLLWGLAGAWLISRLPFMKKNNLSKINTQHQDEISSAPEE